MAWDAPLPFLGQPSGTDVAAFSNPAGATLAAHSGTGIILGQPDSLEGPWDRSWAGHAQENGQALGLKLWEGGAKTEGEFGWTLSKDAGDWVSTGARLTYRYREDAADRWATHGGIQLRPHPAFLAGYWMENLWSTSLGRNHRWSMGLRPLAGSASRLAEFTVGYGMDLPAESKRREAVYVQLPLPLSSTGYVRWDWNEKAASVGISVQATGQIVTAWGLSGPRGTSPSGWRLPKHREASLSFRKQRTTPYLLGHGKVAELDLNRSIAEGEPPRALFGSSGDLSFLELRRRFDMIEADGRIKAVVVRLGRARAGWGMGEEIRKRLLALRSQGKKVVAYMEHATPLNYYLASAADVVAMQPGGHFAVNGFSSETRFYRGFFDKVGVEPQFLRHGRYKAFEEPYTRKSLSPESRANLESYLGSSWDHFLDAVAASRRMPRDSVAKVLAAGDPNLDRARAAGLIDTLVDQDQLLELAGGKHASWIRIGGDEQRHSGWDIPARIAVVVVQGDMIMGKSNRSWLYSPELAGAQTVAAHLKRARLDSDIEAVVIRVESPGGSAQAADIMAREVELLRKAGKPVVASIGHVAASGGYYLICGADRIYCAHNSAVGSIGILWGKFVFKGLQDKLGVTSETIKTAPHADASSLTRPWDSAEVAVLQRHMDDFYDRFTGKVAAGRKLGKEAVDSLAQGRIFTGTQAVKNGLVDSIGGLEEAVREAARLAGIAEDRRVDLAVLQTGSGPGWKTGGRSRSEWQVGPEKGSDGNFLATAWEDILKGMVERYQGLAEGQLWAVSPELAGWSADELR